jgi:nucleoside-diphosphate-sugar epimerase
MNRILITGATGQIGTELTRSLRQRYAADSVFASSRHRPEDNAQHSWAPFQELDVTDPDALCRVLGDNNIDTVFHLAAILSVVGEADPQTAWNVNVNGLRNVLEAARSCGVRRVFWPSSIGVFGPDTPREHTPQDTITRPATMYGVTKVTGELLCDYYVHHYGLDVRGVRYPGVIGSDTPPGGGTTDYAVAIFHAAIKEGRYTCFVREDTVLPMIYMPDCIAAAIELMEADASRLHHHNGFNVAAMSFSAGELAAEIRKHIPRFECRFEPDHRQAIADTWPRDVDDRVARAEWGWQPHYGLAEMTADMLHKLSARHNANAL